MGRNKITQWTRYLTFGLSAVQSFGIAYTLQKSGGFVLTPGVGFVLMTVLTLTTGSVFIMWLGEQITERGVGNGMSLLIFAGTWSGYRAAFSICGTNAKWSMGAADSDMDDSAGYGDVRDRGFHCVCRTQRAPYSGAVR